MAELTKRDITALLERLNLELKRRDIKGTLYLVGGAVMCLAFNTRPSTRDLDGFFLPAAEVRSAAKQVALQNNVPRRQRHGTGISGCQAAASPLAHALAHRAWERPRAAPGGPEQPHEVLAQPDAKDRRLEELHRPRAPRVWARS